MNIGAMIGGKKLKTNQFFQFFQFVLFIASFVLFLFLGEYLWNNVLVKLFTIVRPVTSIWQILGMYVLLAILLK
jgi:hypothetical protein